MFAHWHLTMAQRCDCCAAYHPENKVIRLRGSMPMVSTNVIRFESTLLHYLFLANTPPCKSLQRSHDTNNVLNTATHCRRCMTQITTQPRKQKHFKTLSTFVTRSTPGNLDLINLSWSGVNIMQQIIALQSCLLTGISSA